MRLARGMTGDYGDNRKQSLLWGLWGLWGAGRPVWLAREGLRVVRTCGAKGGVGRLERLVRLVRLVNLVATL